MSNPIAIIKFSNIGEVKLELFNDVANSVANFVSLAESKYYDGLSMHRIIPGFVAQGGCPDGTGMGGPGYTIDGEFASNGFANPHPHEKGVIAWARSMARNSAGSQFYLTLDEARFLDADYAVFGKIIEGEEVLGKLEAFGSQSGSTSQLVTIECVTIDRNNADIQELKKVKCKR